MTAQRFARSCLICGARTAAGESYCADHKTNRRRRACKAAKCPNYAIAGSDYCHDHAPADRRETQPWRREYDSADYRAARLERLAISGGRCELCGKAPPAPVVHHVRPLSAGGTNHVSNLAVLCKSCHRKVHRKLPGRRVGPI